MTSQEIRRRFLAFFEKRGHAIIPSASLVPENDPTVLFNTAGMQPLVPFLMGQKHPNGDKLVNVQKCVRTTDIDDIGDNTHATFFEMLGNWSLGSYFKEEAIKWSYDFLTTSEGLGLDPRRLYVTVFEGDPANNVPRDEESAEIWKRVGIPAARIFYKGVDANWWPAVKADKNGASRDTWTGPTGPNTEMFYDLTGTVGELKDVSEFDRADSEQKIVEIWNDVFMEYEKRDGQIVGKLANKNVDTGAGLERISMIMQGAENIFETDLFEPIIRSIRSFAKTENIRAERIIADHVRTSVFLIADGVTPSNTDRGYVLRRLTRKAIRFADTLGLNPGEILEVAKIVPKIYGEDYEIGPKLDYILSVISEEEQKFRKTLTTGLKEFSTLAKIAKESGENKISGKDAFVLFSSFGFPIDLTIEIAREQGIEIDLPAFNEEIKKHQDLSRTGAEQKFKGGLADTSEMSVKYHTATHMLNAALRKVVGDSVSQKGSNITPERLRFDFNSPEKLTGAQKKAVEDLVNQKIAEDLPVAFEEMSLEKARELGAIGVFGEKYADTVRVYTIGNEQTGIFSREICGGPHVEHTGVLGHFKIAKEEAVSAGVRRIKATLE